MDWIGYTNAGMTLIKKYRYALLIVVIGVVLLTFPNRKLDGEISPTAPEQAVQPSLEESLARILGLIDGAGKVEVLLTSASGEETIYQTDEDLSSGERSADQRKDTVLITGTGRVETGLVKQINPPVYRGAIVVCQGAGDPQVRLAVVEAVMSVTGLTSDKITVLKMK